ncbi:hypothetical protein L1987_21025 [Smallanthus sonchifolius]|uniref:Uncharacterized protein n=1 Tax=Smallanthus sonchifolius TaxID=185202 RepID=A0ACB9ITG6_9ASTR|nr:hypothetical protein L1987_21025 [Smallanthus sonchifolius]
MIPVEVPNWRGNSGLMDGKVNGNFVAMPVVDAGLEKKGRGSPPLWYISANELDFLSAYMRGRLTLDKINATISVMVAYAEANAHLMTASRKKEVTNVDTKSPSRSCVRHKPDQKQETKCQLTLRKTMQKPKRLKR